MDVGGASAVTTKETDRRPDLIVLGCFATALACGSALRLSGLGQPSLWLDELVTLWVASAPSFPDILARCSSCMATPPLPFLVHHMFLGVLGPSEWALRLPAALAGIAAIPVVFLAARRMFGNDAAAVSALALAPPESTSCLRSVIAYVDASTNTRFTMVQSEIFGQVMVALLSPAR
jgi:predicted membrane-bound mannosyltransferase